MHGLNWDDLRLLLAVGQVGSLSGAAGQLGINQSTVSRRLARLEAQLDCRLVDRSVLGINLTQAGTELFQMAEQMSEDVAMSTSRLIGRDTTVSGRLHVTCVDMMIDRFLAPHLAEFSDLYPEVELILEGTMNPINLMKNEADIAIRVSANPHELLVGRRICDFGLAVYTAKGISAEDRDDLAWIGWSTDSAAAAIMTRHFPDAAVRHRTDSFLAVNALVKAGLGLAMMPCYWGDCDPDLKRVFPTLIPEEQGLWLLMHPEKQRLARIRAFVDFMIPRLKAHQSRFEGQGILDA